MDNSDYPTSPYSQSEQVRVMSGVEESKIQAMNEGDQERLRNLKEINID
jgi:hypothetical protein